MATSRTRSRKALTADQAANVLAYRSCQAMAHGIRVVVRTVSGRHRHDGTVGRIVRTTLDHVPQLGEKQGRSNIMLHFDSGVSIPLEQIRSLERAGD